MLVAFRSPIKFSKICFPSVKFRANFELVLQKQFLSVVVNHSKSDFATVFAFDILKFSLKTIDLSTRLRGITTELVGFIPQSLMLKSIVCVRLNS